MPQKSNESMRETNNENNHTMRNVANSIIGRNRFIYVKFIYIFILTLYEKLFRRNITLILFILFIFAITQENS